MSVNVLIVDFRSEKHFSYWFWSRLDDGHVFIIIPDQFGNIYYLLLIMNYFPLQKTNAWDHPGQVDQPNYIDIAKRSGGWIYGSNKICRLIFDWWNYFIISYQVSSLLGPTKSSIHCTINVSVLSSSSFLISSDHLSFLGFHLEEINKNIYKWKKFEKLPNMSDCNYVFFLDSLTPLVLSSQPKLLSVNMSNNLISEIQPGAFTNMTRLVRLILSKNKITKLDKNSLAGG